MFLNHIKTNTASALQDPGYLLTEGNPGPQACLIRQNTLLAVNINRFSRGCLSTVSRFLKQERGYVMKRFKEFFGRINLRPQLAGYLGFLVFLLLLYALRNCQN